MGALWVVRVSQRRHLSVGVALPMGTLILLRFVELPVPVEIATGTQRPQVYFWMTPTITTRNIDNRGTQLTTLS